MSGGALEVQMDCLTVKMVEEIQEAVQNAVVVEPVVAGFQRATLPALVEYGCLRWAMNDRTPALPNAIIESQLGDSLMQVRCDLGLRSTGPPKTRLRRVDTQSIEFHVVTNSLDNADWREFEIRFARSAQSVGFSQKKAHALQAALHEMTENAVIHAEAPTPVLVGYQATDGTALFSVADVGIGVLASLRSHVAYQQLELHKDAIRAALQDGTTRFGPNSRGLGFRYIFRALTAQWGYLRFRSGNGCITLNGEGLDADQGEVSFPPVLPGFQVTVCCRTKAPSSTEPIA